MSKHERLWEEASDSDSVPEHKQRKIPDALAIRTRSRAEVDGASKDVEGKKRNAHTRERRDYNGWMDGWMDRQCNDQFMAAVILCFHTILVSHIIFSIVLPDFAFVLPCPLILYCMNLHEPCVDPPNMVAMDDQDTSAILLNSTLARKRVRVVQLLLVGLCTVVFGFLGSFFVSSSCHFASAEVLVGSNQEVFRLHFGLWKYSPIDSAFDGYSYCSKYDNSYTNDSPHLARLFGSLGLVGGTYSLSVLWFYLIVGVATQGWWVSAVRVSVLSGICQGLTLLFFRDDVCTRNVCSFGPGAIVSLLSAISWFVLAFELHYNMPMSAMIQALSDRNHVGTNVMASLELADFGNSARAYMTRLDLDNKEYIPSLNQMRRNRDGTGSELEQVSAGGSYRPPTIFGA